MSAKPAAVLIADVHYSLKTLKEADTAMWLAIEKANYLNVPLIVAGDLHDTKANLRGECVNAMLATIDQCKIKPYILVGNHDKINEKGYEHSLSFLGYKAELITERYLTHGENNLTLLPYYSDVNQCRQELVGISDGEIVIMHQGLTGSNSGEYFQDHSALNPEDVANLRVISGHYHRRQDIKCGRPRKGHVGLFSYIGNPYTLNFSETGDPAKGFQVLYDDGSLEFIPTNLRRHRKIEIHVDDEAYPPSNPGDILWVVVYGSSDKLTKVTKESLGYSQPFKLELIATEDVAPTETRENISFDTVIDEANIDKDRKLRLKALWKGLLDEDQSSQS